MSFLKLLFKMTLAYWLFNKVVNWLTPELVYYKIQCNGYVTWFLFEKNWWVYPLLYCFNYLTFFIFKNFKIREALIIVFLLHFILIWSIYIYFILIEGLSPINFLFDRLVRFGNTFVIMIFVSAIVTELWNVKFAWPAIWLFWLVFLFTYFELIVLFLIIMGAIIFYSINYR